MSSRPIEFPNAVFGDVTYNRRRAEICTPETCGGWTVSLWAFIFILGMLVGASHGLWYVMCFVSINMQRNENQNLATTVGLRNDVFTLDLVDNFK